MPDLVAEMNEITNIGADTLARFSTYEAVWAIKADRRAYINDLMVDDVRRAEKRAARRAARGEG